jgi:hypothetical protein
VLGWAEAIAQARHDAHAGLAQALLNGSCLGLARHTRPIWSYIPPHNNGGPHLSCRHLVHHLASFLSSLMPPPPGHPILGQRAWEQVPPPRIRPTPAPTPTRELAIAHSQGRFIVCAHHRFRHRQTSRSSSRPSPCSSSPTYCPRSRSQPRADRCSSTRVPSESVLLLSFLCACHA